MFKLINFLFFCLLIILSQITTTNTHPIPLVFNEFVINFEKNNIILKYRLSIDPAVINNIYPIIDRNLDEKTSKEELTEFWNQIVRPNLIAQINNQDLHFEIKDFFLINKTDFRSLNDYLEITLESLFENNNQEINVYFKYDHKFLPEDPYGDSVNFIDNIANNSQIQRLDDIQYYQILNGSEYKAKFKFSENKTTNLQKENNNTMSINITEIVKNLTDYFKNLDFSNPTLTIIGFIILLISGILHAFTPGHGKTVLSVLLINKKNIKFIDVLLLSLSIVISHTGIILIIGTILYIFNLGYLVNNISNLIKDIVAIVFCIFGLYLIYKSYKNYKNQNIKKLILGNKNNVDINKFNENTNITRRTIIYSGLLAGLTPCVEALSIFILFLNLGRIDIALLSTLIFSIGLMISIMLIGIVLLKFGTKNKFLNNIENKSQYLVNLLSGLIILLLSVINLLQ